MSNVVFTGARSSERKETIANTESRRQFRGHSAAVRFDQRHGDGRYRHHRPVTTQMVCVWNLSKGPRRPISQNDGAPTFEIMDQKLVIAAHRRGRIRCTFRGARSAMRSASIEMAR